MSNTSFYLISEPSINGDINLLSLIPNDYELTIYPVNGRALNVSSTYNISHKTLTFNNLIRYDLSNNKVYEWKNDSWNNEVTNYFDTNTGIRIYENNLYAGIKTDISSKTIDINSPWLYMMYGPSSSENNSIVKSITLQSNGYMFTSDIGKVEFDFKGNPIRSLTTSGLPTAPFLRLVVYKYDGYSHMTRFFLSDLYNELKNGCRFIRNSFTYVSFYTPDCLTDVGSYNIYIYGQDIGSGGQEIQVHKIEKSIDDLNWDLTFYVYDAGYDKGLGFKDGNPKYIQYIHTRYGFIRYTDLTYRIYKKDRFTNFTPIIGRTSILPSILPIGSIKTINRDTIYERTNPTVDNFKIIIPNDKPSNRIFVYQSGTNKLLHITDYIQKGTTQNVTIDYTKGINGITSSVTPVIPLPVPQFNKSNLSSDCINSNQYFSCPSSPDLICPDNYIIDTINTGPQTIKYRCKNIYSISENSLRGLGNNPTSETTSDNSGFAKSKTHWLSDGIRGINFTKGNGHTVLTGSANGNTYDFSCDNGKINGFNGAIFGNTGNIILLKTFCALPTIK